MTATAISPTTTPRVQAIFEEVRAALLRVIAENRVTWEEYRAATGFLAEAGRRDFEIPMLLDVCLGQAVDDLTHAHEGTECNVEGPFYVPGAPSLQPPYRLPRRPDEPGARLVVSGTVRSTDGRPLAGATLDVWQANGAGEYSHFHPGVPEHNLRGRLTADGEGRFEFETVIPAAYEIPKDGATGRLLAALGRPCFRPGHIHLKLSHENAAPLTTQIYFDGDPWIDSDVAGAVKQSLVTTLAWKEGDDGGPCASCSYDFVLSPQHAIR
jgi:catechol 1,2-dioxygenase